MPNRILREGINSSPRINGLSMGAELLYRRLMSVVDDFGRFHASPVTIRGACWPTCPEKFRDKQILLWLSECTTNRLIQIYDVDRAKFLQIIDFNQQTRTRSRFPEPQKDHENILHSDGEQIDSKTQASDKANVAEIDKLSLQADCSQNDSNLKSDCSQNDRASRSRISKSYTESEGRPIPINGSPAAWAEKLYARHPKKKERVLAESACVDIWEKTPELFPEIDRVHALWCAEPDWTKENGRFAPKLAEWLKDFGWTKQPRDSPGSVNGGSTCTRFEMPEGIPLV